MTHGIRGIYRDTLIDHQGRVCLKSVWHSNVIVQNCNTLLAALMKSDKGMSGILYFAVGEGESDWDSMRPNPMFTTSQLTTEVRRVVLNDNDIAFLDNTGQPSKTPTNQLEITVTLRGEDFELSEFQSIREFGLFGGNATEESDSGFMINYVIHPRIDLVPGMTLNRMLRLNFSGGFILETELTGFGTTLPVTSIDGIGDIYRADLEAEGIQTLGDLIEIDRLVCVGDIPAVELREFRAKARMVTYLRLDLSNFKPLYDRDISSIISEIPEDLAGEIDSPGVTPEMVTELQEELAIFQIALDDVQLQRIRLDDLINV